MDYSDDKRGKKRVATIAVASIFLVAMVVAVTLGFSARDGSSSADISSSTKAVDSICQTTDYKDACVKSLESTSGDSSDPKKLIQAAFEAAEKYIKAAANKSVNLQELEKDPRASKALSSCKELMESSLEDLKRSINEVDQLNGDKFDEFLANLKTWISAVITNQETCLDGFEETTSDAGKKMQEALKYSMQLSSNALAIVTELSTTLNSLHITGSAQRRLLQDGDNWFQDKIRKLLDGIVPGTGAPLINADLVVAKDGSGHFRTINEALRAIPAVRNKTFVLHIKEGIYQEYVEFGSTMIDIMVIGDGAEKTRITGNKNFVDGTPTYQTPTVVALGERFVAKNIGFENTAGAIKHQAVALRVQSDMAIFYNCSMDGYQDTLYAHSKRQYFRDCTISGTIDFVFGNSAAVFQNCKFVVRKPLDNQRCIVTAQGRKDRRQATGIVIQNSTFTSAPDYFPVRTILPSFLGRPWKNFSRTVIMESYIDDLIHPDGWLAWEGLVNLDTCWYAELNNFGPGADTARRVAWKGIMTRGFTGMHALDFTPGRFLFGDVWIKPSGVPYTSGFVMNETVSMINPSTQDSGSAELPEMTNPTLSVAASPVSSPASAPAASQMGIKQGRKLWSWLWV